MIGVKYRKQINSGKFIRSVKRRKKKRLYSVITLGNGKGKRIEWLRGKITIIINIWALLIEHKVSYSFVSSFCRLTVRRSPHDTDQNEVNLLGKMIVCRNPSAASKCSIFSVKMHSRSGPATLEVIQPTYKTTGKQ